MLLQQIIPGGNDAIAERNERFGAWWCMAEWIAPKLCQQFVVLGQQLSGCLSFPRTETDLLQTRLHLQRPLVALSQPFGKGPATAQWRSHDQIPWTVIAYCLSRLMPAKFAQRIIDLPAIFFAAHRFAVANHVDGGGD